MHLFTISAALKPSSLHEATLSCQVLSDIWKFKTRKMYALHSARYLTVQMVLTDYSNTRECYRSHISIQKTERNTKNSQTKKEEKACQTVALVPHTLELHQSDEQHFIKLTIIVASVLTPSAPHSLLSHSRHVVRFVFLRKIVQSHRSDRLQRSSIVWIGDRREEGWKGHQGDVHR